MKIITVIIIIIKKPNHYNSLSPTSSHSELNLLSLQCGGFKCCNYSHYYFLNRWPYSLYFNSQEYYQQDQWTNFLVTNFLDGKNYRFTIIIIIITTTTNLLLMNSFLIIILYSTLFLEFRFFFLFLLLLLVIVVKGFMYKFEPKFPPFFHFIVSLHLKFLTFRFDNLIFVLAIV